ncbi:ABC transporter substrate-binding protein [Cryobacterium arcticum]|uniref:ABC transporter substrate-binding protein n=1 Tax=Cryobacterium arcticum TaxID=670052 RepID=A0A1B1BM13_9MICO|nr:ABC transporter substrate-binding protein [Cryobacterium arcticum]ANP73574.1 ABC transporter substrate-binding protein [Cryobacterium arcticum]
MHSKKRLVTTAVATATAGLLVMLTGCSGSASEGSDDGKGPITFASGKDLTGAMPQLIDMWNKENPDQKVTFLELSASPDDQRTSFVQDFQAKSGNYDVVWGDVVWTSEFAAYGWLEELDPAKVAGDDILPAAVESATYDGKVWAAPFMTNAGLLYYRSDLIDTPPTTWAELAADCEIAKANSMDCYAGQFAQYEGLTVNVAEAINSAGGSFLSEDGKSVAVDSPEARAGLGHLVDMFKSGDINPAGITYQEQESATAFLDGDVMFLRNWPYVFTAASEEGSAIKGKFGIAQLPGQDGNGVSSLGGINLGVSAFSKHKETAKAWVEWMQSDEAQRVLVSVMNQASVRSDLYSDAELVTVSPYLPTLEQSELTAVPRPRTPNYNAVSLAIQKNAYAALQGTMSVDQAITQMAADLGQAIK